MIQLFILKKKKKNSYNCTEVVNISFLRHITFGMYNPVDMHWAPLMVIYFNSLTLDY
jgi:hypothetical protein